MLAQILDPEPTTTHPLEPMIQGHPKLRIAGTMLTAAADLLEALERIERPAGNLDFAAEADRLAAELTALGIMVARSALAECAK